MYVTHNGNHALAVARTVKEANVQSNVEVKVLYVGNDRMMYAVVHNGHVVQMSPEPELHNESVGARLREYGMPEVVEHVPTAMLSEGWM